MSKKKTPTWAQPGHSKPVTRRDFLAAGMLPFAASIFIPNWVSLLVGETAHGQNLNCPNSPFMIPFITLNLNGGAAMSSNWVPMNAGGDPLKSYNTMGLGNNQLPIERVFGNATFAGGGISKMLTGIRASASAGTIANTAFIGIPCESVSDTPFNKFDLSGAVTKAGLNGTMLANLGVINTPTGIRQNSALAAPPAPLVVSSFSAITNAIEYTAKIGSSLTKGQKSSLVRLMNNLTHSQAKKIADVSGGPALESLLACAGIKNVSNASMGSSVLNPMNNSAFSQIWKINAFAGDASQQRVFGAMVYNSLMGYAGTANLELGGYDYHDETRGTGDAKDLEAGTVMGQILQSAALLGKPVMLYVISDGSVMAPGSEDRNAPWTGDSSTTGASYLFYYDPKGRPAVSSHQIGCFTDLQVVDTSQLTGSTPESAATAVLANWLQANKRIDLFSSLGGLFDASQLKQVIKVA